MKDDLLCGWLANWDSSSRLKFQLNDIVIGKIIRVALSLHLGLVLALGHERAVAERCRTVVLSPIVPELSVYTLLRKLWILLSAKTMEVICKNIIDFLFDSFQSGYRRVETFKKIWNRWFRFHEVVFRWRQDWGWNDRWWNRKSRIWVFKKAQSSGMLVYSD